MLFVDLKFFVFFAIVLTIYWSLRSNSARKNFILVASYYFYGSWDWRFAGMLLVLSAADWWFALRLSQTANQRARKTYVTASLAMNLGVLAFFKYFHFFLSSAQALADSFKLHLSGPTLRIILPVGVSFFTFQSLSYTIDVYRREIPPVESLRDYLIIAQNEPRIEHWTRQADGTWKETVALGLDASLTLSGVPVTLHLAKVYRYVVFPPSLLEDEDDAKAEEA